MKEPGLVLAQLVLPAAPASLRRWSRAGRGQDAARGQTHRGLKSSITAVTWPRATHYPGSPLLCVCVGGGWEGSRGRGEASGAYWGKLDLKLPWGPQRQKSTRHLGHRGLGYRDRAEAECDLGSWVYEGVT